MTKSKFLSMAEEYVEANGAHEATVMAMHIFYVAMKKQVEEGYLSPDTISDKGLLEMFTKQLRGYKELPSVFEKTGVYLRRYD